MSVESSLVKLWPTKARMSVTRLPPAHEARDHGFYQLNGMKGIPRQWTRVCRPRASRLRAHLDKGNLLDYINAMNLGAPLTPVTVLRDLVMRGNGGVGGADDHRHRRARRGSAARSGHSRRAQRG